MSLCIIIPTMSRPSNGLDYMKETLSKNNTILKKYTTCVYINETDKTELEPLIEGYTIIPRVNHDDKLPIKDKSQYEYWRTHLCADFMYCLSEAASLHPECEHFMWLEDDVLLHPRFDQIWDARKGFKWTSSGHGATCVVSTKEYLVKGILPTIEKHWLAPEALPLDWMYRHLAPKTHLRETVAFHIGIQSTRENVTRVENDRARYNRIVSLS